MIYINPIEILDLKGKEVNEIDSSIIRKSKRRLFADIDLSDNGLYNYYGQKLTKSDCERAIDELEDKNKIEFYSHLSTNFELNSFLANGSNELLNNLKQESIYKLPEFVDFISPYFSAKIDHLLLKSFQNNELELFSTALRAEYLISQSDMSKAYKSLSNEIQQRIAETDKLTVKIKEEISDYTTENIDSVIKVIKVRFPSGFLNELPVYFQSQINKIATSINYLVLSTWNEFDSTSVPVALLEHLLELNLSNVSKPIFEDNYEEFRVEHVNRIEKERNAPLLKKWAKVLISIQEKIELVKIKTLKAGEAVATVKSAFDMGELNNLPSFADDIRTQIALSIRSISIACWNEQEDIKSALFLIEFALKLKLKEEDKLKLEQDKIELLELEQKYKQIFTCFFCETNMPDKNCGFHKTIYKVKERNIFQQRVEYSYLPLIIPRCESCKKVHSKSDRIYIFALTGLALGVILGVIIFKGPAGFLIGIVGLVAGVWVEKKTEKVPDPPVKKLNNRILKQHPLLREKIESGWTFSKPKPHLL